MPPQVFIHGELDSAEQIVLDALYNLPTGAILYAQPELVHGRDRLHPDFVIVYDQWGIVVLEVKDWIQVVESDSLQAKIRQRNNDLVWRDSPLKQARKAAQLLARAAQRDKQLVDFAGKLDFSYAYGGVLPHLPPSVISSLESAWGETYILGRDDLHPERITERIARIDVPFRLVLTTKQVDAIRAIIDRRNKNVDRSTGEFKGIYSQTQEEIAKEPVLAKERHGPERKAPVQASMDLPQHPSAAARIEHLEEEMPDEAKSLKSAHHVRLLRGFAGTGKTDVLILRAHYLHEQYDDLDILVTTFNDLLWQKRLKPELEHLQPRVDVIKCDTICSGIYRKRHGVWRCPLDTLGLVAAMASEFPLIDELGRNFLADEFIWMKETGRTNRSSYISGVREGRGAVGGRRMGRKMKGQVFDLFEAYQARLHDMPAYDWVDLHEKTLAYLNEGVEPDRLYDVILIDEAQHFAPTWLRIIERLLKPNGTLFLCDDPSQSVYRYYSWREKGVEVVGRTRWLRVPYRNTRQIFEAAFALIADNPLARKRLAESGEEIDPDLQSRGMRDGPRPEVHYFPFLASQAEFVQSEVAKLIESGIVPNEIGILHDKKHVLSHFRQLVPRGVQSHEIRRQTGLEYKAVFIPQIQDLFDRTIGMDWGEDKARSLLKSYMSMTRARDRLYLLHCQQWPSLLEPVRPHVEWIEHAA